MSRREITLLVPGLLAKTDGLPPEAGVVSDAVDVEALEWLLTLAECRSQSPVDPLAQLWQRVGQMGPVPVAALSYRYDRGELPTGPVLRADPVCLVADRDCVRMLNADLPDLSEDEAAQLITEINTQFSDEPWQLVLGVAQRWYLLLDNDAAVTTQAPAQALGKDIHGYMPSGEQQGYWRSVMNEIQMLLYSSPVNQERQAQGRVPVSSLWFWGEGALPDALSLPWDEVYSNGPVIAGMGLVAGVPVAPVSTAMTLLEQASVTARILCEPTLAVGSLGRGKFNQDWALPLYKALQRGLLGAQPKSPLDQMELLTQGRGYVLSAGKRRWWRHRRMDSFLD